MSDNFHEVLQALMDVDHPLPPKYLHRFSDLEKGEQVLLSEKWEQIANARKLTLLEDLIDLSDTETLVNFDELGMIALNDSVMNVRVKALELLEYSEDYHLIPHLIKTIQKDPEVAVKSAAVQTAANFVYKGEVDEYPKDAFYKLTALLKELLTEKNPEEIQQKALEAIGYSSEKDVKNFIEIALSQTNERWKSSAIIAMGRSLDPRWKKIILDELLQDNPSTVISAIKAAGDMEIPSARSLMLTLIKNHSGDDLIQKNSAWALARIGGPGVKSVIEKLLSNAEGEDETSFYEDCLDEYAYRHDPLAQSMFNFKVENDKDVVDEEMHDDLADFEDAEDFTVYSDDSDS